MKAVAMERASATFSHTASHLRASDRKIVAPRFTSPSAPVILAEGLTKSDVKDYSPKLAELSKAGLEFRITARPTRGLPKVHWPGGQPFSGGEAEFSFNNGAFVCPSCGESFLFQRAGEFSIEEPA